MPFMNLSEQSFFQQVGEQFASANAKRSKDLTDWYNRYFAPVAPLRDRDAHWFHYTRRFHLRRFDTVGEFGDAFCQIIFNPFLFSALAAIEAAKFSLCLPAVACKLLRGRFDKLAINMLQMIESLIAAAVFTAMAAIEWYFQVVLFAVRVGSTVFSWVTNAAHDVVEGAENHVDSDSDVEDIEDENQEGVSPFDIRM